MSNNPPDSIETILGLQNPVRNWKRSLHRWIIIGVIAAIIISLILLAFSGKAKPVEYHTVAAKMGDLKITVTATGNLEATTQVDVGSELSGIVKTVEADFNDIVKIKQPLVRLDNTKYIAAVKESQAEVTGAKADYQQALATLEETQKILERYRNTRKLTNNRMPSIEVLEAAEAEFNRSRAAIMSAKAAIEKAEATLMSNNTDLEKTVIYSPINGIVLSRDIEPGQTVAASLEAPVLFTLAEDLRQMELQVDVDEADVGQVKAGQKATFTVDAYPSREFEAQITQVRYGAETTDNVVSYTAVLKVENPDLLLRPGMTATATIIIEEMKNTLLVPNSALTFTPQKEEVPQIEREGGLIDALFPHPPKKNAHKQGPMETTPLGKPGQTGPFVYVLEGNLPIPKSVSVGITDGAHTAITSGELKPGMSLILNEVNVDDI
ncbi:MAG: efflux RND transporter periplasmic adaptor subunit [Desulfobacteraceae bacterium]|jgi:HlyD family secretion protein